MHSTRFIFSSLLSLCRFFRASSLSNQISAHLFCKLVDLLRMKLADQLAYQTINYAVVHMFVCVCVCVCPRSKGCTSSSYPFYLPLAEHLTRVVSPVGARKLAGVCVWIADSLICQSLRARCTLNKWPTSLEQIKHLPQRQKKYQPTDGQKVRWMDRQSATSKQVNLEFISTVERSTAPLSDTN